jgi:dienelactone hydrolase
MRHRVALAALLLALSLAAPGHAMTPEERKAYWDKFSPLIPPVTSWTAWQQKTNALPPDFDALPKVNGLPDPLTFADGKRTVKTADDWKDRRAEIRQLFEKYQIGAVPPKPTLDHIVPLNESEANGFRTRVVRLEYGPDSKITTQVTVTIPPGNGPFPVLMGASGAAILRRGYITCDFPTSVDTPLNLTQYYPDYDFGSMGQVAFTARMVVDYLYTLPEVDKPHIAITGYSRLGKMATIAAMLDERIAAVVAGSTGVGGVLPWRSAGERGAGEGIESTTRSFPLWFAPQLRFFTGREDRLPIDGNLLVAAIAPRSILQVYGLNDEVSNSYANEQSYFSAQKVFTLLGAPDHSGILRVPGFHGANDLQGSLDWLDIQFGRSTRTWQNNFLFPWDYDRWLKNSRETADVARFPAHAPNDTLAGVTSTADWEAKAADVRKAITWMLGDAPPMPPAGRGRGGFPARGPARGPIPGRGAGPGGAAGPADGAPAPGPAVAGAPGTAPAADGAPGRAGPGAARGGLARGGGRGAPAAGPNPAQLGPDVVAWVIQRANSFGWYEPYKSQTESRKLSFGDGVTGDLYYPAGTAPDAKLPTVIWLHGYSYPLGYMWVYRTAPDLHPILALVKQGYAVLAFDQTGHGSRMNEFAAFYDRYPHWSRLGRMVEDARAGIDALQRDPMVNPDQIYLFGYSLGGMVALHTAALDPRVKGVVSIAGFTPMRTDTADKGTGGLARYSRDLPLAPRLGFFIGNEARLPYDYNELIAAIAPRPVYLVQPALDRDATPGEVHDAVDQARKIYGLYNAADKLALDEPWDYNRLPSATQERAISWMKDNMH